MTLRRESFFMVRERGLEARSAPPSQHLSKLVLKS